MIYLTGAEAATNTDILNNTRLSSIPYVGQLTIQAQANLNNATNNFVITIQLPDGSVPVDAQRLNAGQEGDALGGQLDQRYLTQWSFPVPQTGGHFTISLTETGAAIASWRIVLRP